MRRIRYTVSVVFMMSGLLIFFQNCSPSPELVELQALSTMDATHAPATTNANHATETDPWVEYDGNFE